MIRIALIHNIVTPHAVRLYELLATESDLDLTVYFLSSTDKNRQWNTVIGKNFAYRILPNWALRLHGADLFTYFVNPTLPWVLARDGFDVVIADGWDSFASAAALLVAKLLHKRYVIWAGSTANEPSWRRSLAAPLVQFLVRSADGCIAYGTRAKAYLCKLGADERRIVISYNTVDVDWFVGEADRLRPSRDPVRNELGLHFGPVILYVGQLIRRKGLLDLLDAYEMLVTANPDVQLVIVGRGQLEGTLRERIERRNLHGVLLIGHVPTPELPRYYVAADCFVLPSREEVWGLVLNEAAACGLPLVTAAPVGAAPDLIEPGVNGLVVAAARPRDLASALRDALDNRVEWGRESRRIVARATFTQNVKAIRQLLRQIEAN